MPQSKILTELLRTLLPKNEMELTLLKLVVECAQTVPKTSLAHPQRSAEVQSLLALIPEEARRYFHGLAEALEVYQSIHGEALKPASLTLTDNTIHTVRQIRDLCSHKDALF